MVERGSGALQWSVPLHLWLLRPYEPAFSSDTKLSQMVVQVQIGPASCLRSRQWPEHRVMVPATVCWAGRKAEHQLLECAQVDDEANRPTSCNFLIEPRMRWCTSRMAHRHVQRSPLEQRPVPSAAGIRQRPLSQHRTVSVRYMADHLVADHPSPPRPTVCAQSVYPPEEVGAVLCHHHRLPKAAPSAGPRRTNGDSGAPGRLCLGEEALSGARHLPADSVRWRST
jgi:hypothetical protein